MNNKEIVDYYIVRTPYHRDLVDSVNRGIKDGYEPLGGVSVSIGSISDCYCQAMVKYKIIPDE